MLCQKDTFYQGFLHFLGCKIVKIHPPKKSMLEVCSLVYLNPPILTLGKVENDFWKWGW